MDPDRAMPLNGWTRMLPRRCVRPRHGRLGTETPSGSTVTLPHRTSGARWQIRDGHRRGRQAPGVWARAGGA